MAIEPEQTTEPPPEDNQEEEPKRPSLVKQAVPWVVTFLIFYWLFKRVDFAVVWEEMQGADLWILVPPMAGLVGVQAVLEIWTFGVSYKWFADRHPSYWQVAVARIGAYPMQALFAPLAGVQMLAYLVRVYKMRLALALASDIFTIFPDLVQGAIGILVAVILVHLTGGEPLHWFFYAFCVWNIIFYAFWFSYWQTGLKDRLWTRFRDVTALQSFRLANWGQYGKMFLMRLPWFFATLASMYCCLIAFDIHVPITIFLIAAPLIMGMAFQPVSVGGYGGPQALAILFFKNYAAEEAILAQSLLWSTFFTLFRILAGMIFLYPMIRGFQQADKIKVASAPVPDPAGLEE